MPLNATVPVVLLITMLVPVSTVDPKVAPPLLVRVKLPISVPIAPVILTAPVLLITTLELAPPAVPVIEATVIAPELPPPRYRVTPSPKMTLFKVIEDEPKSKVLVELKKLVVPPILNEQVVPVLQSLGLPAVKVPKRILLPVIWVIPRENVRVSEVESP